MRENHNEKRLEPPTNGVRTKSWTLGHLIKEKAPNLGRNDVLVLFDFITLDYEIVIEMLGGHKCPCHRRFPHRSHQCS